MMVYIKKGNCLFIIFQSHNSIRTGDISICICNSVTVFVLHIAPNNYSDKTSCVLKTWSTLIQPLDVPEAAPIINTINHSGNESGNCRYIPGTTMLPVCLLVMESKQAKVIQNNLTCVQSEFCLFYKELAQKQGRRKRWCLETNNTKLPLLLNLSSWLVLWWVSVVRQSC